MIGLRIWSRSGRTTVTEGGSVTFFTVNEVAERLRVRPSTVYKWLQRGELGCVKRGSRWTRVTDEQLRVFAERHSIPAGRVR